jgi:predicted metal-dependent hydrolase
MERQQHPLTNPDSKHYKAEKPGDKALIEKFEEKYSVKQLYDWAMISEDKYFGRMGRKDDIEKETIKMDTYNNYKKMLKQIIDKYPMLADMTAKTAYQHLKYDWIY